MVLQRMLDQRSSMCLGQVLQHVEHQKKIVRHGKRVDDLLDLADVNLAIDVTVQGREVPFEFLDPIDSPEEAMIVLPPVQQLQVLSTEKVVSQVRGLPSGRSAMRQSPMLLSAYLAPSPV